ncbi:NnrU family protein [Azospirillum soli]|uniref:NnrU family protein n=1 Tax=Azospirillum soli TaxID=1304799 RepID=UPI001AEB396E|nr:NnrU family protein [Azospirillum soli]MBP2313575.1 putative membrane protein [Azospirillum soli]
MTSTLTFAALLLFVSHAAPSWPGVRPALIARLGRPGFVALHSLGSLATLALFVYAYREAGGGMPLFIPAGWAAPLVVALMPLAFLLILARITTKFGEHDRPNPPAGIYRITRFPGSMGLLLWALLHLQATGDGRRVVLFVTMAAIALFAMIKNDWVLRRTDAGQTFRAETSALPFAAVLAGRQRLVWSEIGWGRALGTVAAYAAMLIIHPWLFGVSPLYWL